MNRKDYNVLITNVSTINLTDGQKYPDEKQYIDAAGNEYSGRMTNEAPIKSVAKRLINDRKKLDAIVYIASDRVRTEIELVPENSETQKKTHVGFLDLWIKEYLMNILKISEENLPEIKPIEISDEPNVDMVSKTVFDVYDYLTECLNKCEQLNIYIESNGGVRYVLTMLLSVAKSLERMYPGKVHIREVLSMVVGKPPISIKDTKMIYDTAQISGIVDEYIHYGRVEGLKEYLAPMEKELDAGEKARLNELVGELQKIAEDIQLCRTSMMLSDFYSEGGIRKKIKGYLKEHKSSEVAAVCIFSFVLKSILNQYADIYAGELDAEDTITYLPQMIKWCKDKSFYQQALTLCSEKIPEYLMKSGFIRLSRDMNKVLDKMNKKDYERNYYFFAHLSLFMNKLAPIRANIVIKVLKDNPELVDVNYLNTDTLSTPDTDNPGNEVIAIANDLKQLYQEYKSWNGDEKTLKSLLRDNNFNEELTDEKINISEHKKASVFNALSGYSDDNQETIHVNLRLKKDRFVKIIECLIKSRLRSEKDRIHEMFDAVLNSLELDEEKKNGVKQKFAENICNKYSFLDELETGHIIVGNSQNRDAVQLIFLIWGLCKEQRNFSNHAQVSDEDQNAAMNINETGRLIDTMLEYLSGNHKRNEGG